MQCDSLRLLVVAKMSKNIENCQQIRHVWAECTLVFYFINQLSSSDLEEEKGTLIVEIQKEVQ